MLELLASKIVLKWTLNLLLSTVIWSFANSLTGFGSKLTRKILCLWPEFPWSSPTDVCTAPVSLAATFWSSWLVLQGLTLGLQHLLSTEVSKNSPRIKYGWTKNWFDAAADLRTMYRPCLPLEICLWRNITSLSLGHGQPVLQQFGWSQKRHAYPICGWQTYEM